MKDILKFSLVLGLVTGIAAYALAMVNQITKPRIAFQQQLALNEGLYAVLPGSDNGCIIQNQLDDQNIFYKGYLNQDTTGFIGYALPVESKGYSSTIRTLVGLDSSQKIIALKILFQQETPGLGTKCEEIRPGDSTPWFQDQFEGITATSVFLSKEGGSIQSITGATITSAAITNGVRASSSQLFNVLDKDSGSAQSSNGSTPSESVASRIH